VDCIIYSSFLGIPLQPSTYRSPHRRRRRRRRRLCFSIFTQIFTLFYTLISGKQWRTAFGAGYQKRHDVDPGLYHIIYFYVLYVLSFSILNKSKKTYIIERTEQQRHVVTRIIIFTLVYLNKL